MSAPPAWLADPTGRHQMRYWDGQQWTDYVSNAGVQATDPVGSPATNQAAQTPAASGGWMDKVTAAANQAVDATSAAVDSAADSLNNRPAQPVQATTAAPATGTVAAASAPVVADQSALIADELGKLAKLRDAGVLTEDEFAAQKAKLLS